MQRLASIFSAWLRPFSTIAVIIGAWWLATTLGWVNPLFLPTLSSVAKALVSLLCGSEIYVDTAATIYRALAGLAVSVLVGVPLGLMFGRFPLLYQFFELPVDFFRSIPSSALFFLFVLGFGVGDASKVAVVFYGCSLILLVSTIYGAKPTREKQDRINMLRSFGATPFQTFYFTVFRDALPHITAGLRVCVSLSLVLVIVTEMFLGASSGLGRQIYDFYLAYRIPEMYAVIILLGLLGYAANKASLLIEHRTSFWMPRQDRGA
ncbi:MAG: ABC transporter permease [Methylococcales bacterium]